MDNKSHLTVYKASAGSGKTFRLAVQYITMLVNHPEEYRSILAVTFTNKATAEMKQRILSQLYGIAHNLKSSQGYYNEVRNAVNMDEHIIRGNARLALDFILQDYGRFRVETIDSFFQSVLRGLARELGVGAGLSLELDIETVIDDAVDAFLASVEQDSPDKRNIMRFVENNIDNDKSWSIDFTLKDFAKELFKEIFMENGQRLREILAKDDDAVAKYKENLTKARDAALPHIVEKIQETGQQILDALSENGHGVQEMLSSAQGITNKILDGSVVFVKEEQATLPNCASDPEKIFGKKAIRDSHELEILARDILMPLYAKTIEQRSEYNRLKNSYELALQYLHELSLLLSIRKEIEQQNQEQGRFILADTPQLLHQMKEGDTSFVFEKTGSFIRHLMIDEFQDTSRLQWSNLYLLLNECLAYGQDCLVVGDVKQSIYRWRNSDWNILNTELQQKLARYKPDVKVMDGNYRSKPRVIEFNNTLFPKTVGILAGNYNDLTHGQFPALSQAYDKVGQKGPKQINQGYVYAEVITESYPLNQLTEVVCTRIADHLDHLTQAGVLQTDIAILCRKKNQISCIAEWFAHNRPEYNMISSEAFQLDSSAAVRILVSAMRWIADCTNKVALAQLAWEYQCTVVKTERTFDQIYADGLRESLPEELTAKTDALRQLPLYELTEKLYNILGLDRIEGQGQYVMAFMDTICQWTGRKPGALDEFIDDWDDSLHETPIPAPDINGIRLITIHKSKGLEFHTVIAPFCDWPIVKSGDRIWIEPDAEPFDAMPLLPVGFSGKLEKTVFKKHYDHEAGMQTVDNLNLLYVALTRAMCNIIIMANPNPKGLYSIQSVLTKALSSDPFQTRATNDGFVYETGKMCPHENRKKEASGNPFDIKPAPQPLQFNTYPISASFRQSTESSRFVNIDDDDRERQEEYIHTGSLMHSLFANIRTEADIDPQVDQMLRDGLLESDQKAQKLKQDIRKHIAATPGAADWFSGKYRLFNESAIIFRDGGMSHNRRPDRVMITPDGCAIVVDFKFGRENEDYMHQVQEYMDLLRKMGYTQVEGYLWYVYTNKIINC